MRLWPTHLELRRGLLVCGMAAALLAGGRAQGAPLSESPIALNLSEARFWDGPTIADGKVTRPELCGLPAPCPTYALHVEGGGERLRVAIDTPARDDSFRVELIDAAGVVVARAENGNQFNAEAFVEQPAAGLWTVRVVPTNATHAAFRLRAKLEAPSERRAKPAVPLLPNLKSVPPYEFGFVAPANPLNSTAPDAANPPRDAAGVHPLSCAPDELLPQAPGDSAPRRCLRFTAGPINVGPGPYEMRYSLAEDLLAGRATPPILRGPRTQRIHFSDGTTSERDGGTYSFHTTHAHFHDDGVLTYDLYRVIPAAPPRLERAGEGTKSGFCYADQLFGEWRRFTQARPRTLEASIAGCFSASDGSLVLSAGWGDTYRWQRAGQYVEFEGQGDGLYVLRSTVDLANHVLETDDADNSAYALIRVTGDSVRLIERGQGLSPWDPGKVEFNGAGPASEE